MNRAARHPSGGRLTPLTSTIALTAALFATVGPTGLAAAQPTEPDPAFRALIEDALEEYERGSYAESRALFIQAHAMSPSARTLRGIGIASFHLRDYAKAYLALSESLESEVRPLTEELRHEVSLLRDRARAFVALVNVETMPPTATLLVDGAEVDPGPQVLALGTHIIRAEAAGRSAERSVHVRGNEELEMVLDLLEPVRPAPVMEGSDPPREVAEVDRTLPIAMFTTAGILTAGSIASIHLLVEPRGRARAVRRGDLRVGARRRRPSATRARGSRSERACWRPGSSSSG